MDSGTVCSKQLYQLTPFQLTGVATTHTGGFMVLPHPYFYIYSLYETSAGSQVLTDVNTAGTGYNGFYGGAANVSAIFPAGVSGRVRMAALGVRVTYEGTELNRAGRIFAGLCPIQYAASGKIPAGTALSALSTICGSPESSVASMKQCMTNFVSARVSDGTFEAHWFPNGVPTYQSLSSTGAGWLPYTTTAGAQITPSAFNAPPGLAGVQGGQNVLVVFVENDTVPIAQAFGNTYTVELIAHWEVIPSVPWGVSYPLSPSTYSPQQLQSALNSTRLVLGASQHDTTLSSGRSAEPNKAQGSGTTTSRSTYDLAGAFVRALQEAERRARPHVMAAASNLAVRGTRRAVQAATIAAAGAVTRRSRYRPRIEL